MNSGRLDGRGHRFLAVCLPTANTDEDGHTDDRQDPYAIKIPRYNFNGMLGVYQPISEPVACCMSGCLVNPFKGGNGIESMSEVRVASSRLL